MGSQRGSIALAICFAFVAVCFFGGIYYIYTLSTDLPSAKSDPFDAYADLQDRVEKAMSQPHLLNASVERNPNSFGCLFTVSADCTGMGGAFQLFEFAEPNSPPLSQLPKGAGLTLEGMGCRSFPSELCPLRVEASWQPVCSGHRCEGTRTAKLQARVMLHTGEAEPRSWDKEKLFTPSVKLSQAVICERGGGVWALTECLTDGQAQAREIASGLHDDRTDLYQQRERERNERELEVHCPPDLEIQGEFFPMIKVGVNRAITRVPAMNGCPAEDVFTFECQPQNPEDREGQWIQVEAQMAPNCDGNGMPIQRPRE